MCGIVGYVGDKQAAPILLEGLTKLEYRGYDSAGIAAVSYTHLDVYKRQDHLLVDEPRTYHVNANRAPIPGGGHLLHLHQV